MSLGWISSLWGDRVNLVACPVSGGASGVGFEEVDSFSSAAVTHVLRVPRAFITSLKVGSDSSSDTGGLVAAGLSFLFYLSVLSW